MRSLLGRAMGVVTVSTILIAGCTGGSGSRQTDNDTSTTASLPVAAQTRTMDDSSALAFVRRFYSMYAPPATRGGLEVLDSVIVNQPSLFSVELLGALQRDASARAKAKGEIVGLDFDPFLASQDPCSKYEVNGVTHDGGNVRVNVFAICDGKRSVAPVVSAEVSNAGGRLQFGNFLYPDHGTLTDALRVR